MEASSRNPKISVIVITNREGWFEILKDDMERQTFKDFEVIVANDSIDWADPVGWTVFTPRQANDDDVWNINKAYNDAIGQARGELLVFLQDFIWISANGLQRFWDMYQLYPDSLITGVGHKAKIGLEGISEVDDRVFAQDVISPGNHSHWELNWASCPRSSMPLFNEEMDRFYGGENHYIAKKSGKQVLIDRNNQCIGMNQADCGGRPENWEVMHVNKEGRLAHFLDSI